MSACGHIRIAFWPEFVEVSTTHQQVIEALMADLKRLLPEAKFEGPMPIAWDHDSPVVFYYVRNLEFKGESVALWLLGHLCASGWEMFQYYQERIAEHYGQYHFRFRE